jgi:peptidylprolyl isomerase
VTAKSWEEGSVRKTPALLSAVAVAAVLAASLVGCSASGSASCTPAYASGSTSKTVTVSGSAKQAPTASFPTPLVAKSGGSQVSRNDAGSGAQIRNGDQVDYEYMVFSGATGEALGGSGFGANGATTPRIAAVASENGKATTSLTRSLICARDGERYTLVTTAKDGFGKGALTPNGINDSDTLVVVVEIEDHFLGKANGINQLPLDGMPNVITAVNGQPGIVIQELDKPKDLRISTIKAGSGPVVKKGATVHLKFTGWTWPDTGDKPTTWNESTWDNDRAADIPVTSTDDGGALPPGMFKALVGAKVGSQVLVVIPPKDGFASGSAPSGVDPNSTLIMVMDVLGIA